MAKLVSQNPLFDAEGNWVGLETVTQGECLCIVGSVCLEGSDEAYRIAGEAILRYYPALVISGGAAGVDTIAETAALGLGYPFKKFPPEGKGWLWYKKRNLAMAKACTRLVRIVSKRSKTYGSGWTRDRAAEMGKPTEEFVLD